MAAEGQPVCRPATHADADAIADLHAASWRAAYRGILSDAYLDGPVAAERLALWRARFADPGALIIEMAEAGGRALALAALLPEADPAYGTLIDNLHVAPDARGQGLAGSVLAGALARLRDGSRIRPVHLTVFVANALARQVYGRWGGLESEPFRKPEPDGREHDILRVTWGSAATLLDRLSGRPT